MDIETFGRVIPAQSDEGQSVLNKYNAGIDDKHLLVEFNIMASCEPMYGVVPESKVVGFTEDEISQLKENGGKVGCTVPLSEEGVGVISKVYKPA